MTETIGTTAETSILSSIGRNATLSSTCRTTSFPPTSAFPRSSTAYDALSAIVRPLLCRSTNGEETATRTVTATLGTSSLIRMNVRMFRIVSSIIQLVTRFPLTIPSPSRISWIVTTLVKIYYGK